MRKYGYLIAVLGLLAACTSLGFKDTVYVLDAPNSNLRGHAVDGSDDKPLASCDPSPVPSSSPAPGENLSYPCIVHYISDYKALLNEVARLQTELSACQQGFKP